MLEEREDIISKDFCRSKCEFSEDSREVRNEFTIGVYPIPENSYYFNMIYPEVVTIPGHQDVTRDSCGTIFKIKNCKETNIKSISHVFCYQPGCPICYNAWSLRASERLTKRVFALHRIQSIYHWTISFDVNKADTRYYFFMEKTLKKAFPTCFYWFHPFRLQDVNGVSIHDKNCDRSTLRWVEGPHFHVLTWTKRIDSKLFYEEYSAVCHRIGRLGNGYDDCARLVAYEYSHVGLVKTYKGWCCQATSIGKFAACKLNKLLFAMRIKHVHVKCSCEECKEKEFLEERSDLEVARVLNQESVRENHSNCIKIISNASFDSEFVDYYHSEIVYYPKFLLQDKSKFNRYFYRLGLLRYVSTEFIKRHHQISLDNKEFGLSYNNSDKGKFVRIQHTMYPIDTLKDHI